MHTHTQQSKWKKCNEKMSSMEKNLPFLKIQTSRGRPVWSAGRASDVIIEIGKNIVYLFFILQLFRVFFVDLHP